MLKTKCKYAIGYLQSSSSYYNYKIKIKNGNVETVMTGEDIT